MISKNAFIGAALDMLGLVKKDKDEPKATPAIKYPFEDRSFRRIDRLAHEYHEAYAARKTEMDEAMLSATRDAFGKIASDLQDAGQWTIPETSDPLTGDLLIEHFIGHLVKQPELHNETVRTIFSNGFVTFQENIVRCGTLRDIHDKCSYESGERLLTMSKLLIKEDGLYRYDVIKQKMEAREDITSSAQNGARPNAPDQPKP